MPFSGRLFYIKLYKLNPLQVIFQHCQEVMSLISLCCKLFGFKTLHRRVSSSCNLSILLSISSFSAVQLSFILWVLNKLLCWNMLNTWTICNQWKVHLLANWDTQAVLRTNYCQTIPIPQSEGTGQTPTLSPPWWSVNSRFLHKSECHLYFEKKTWQPALLWAGWGMQVSQK